MNKKRSKFRKLIWPLLGILVVALAALIFMMPKKINYTEVKPLTGNLATYYTFTGSVEAKNRQDILADKAMQIKKINVTKGQQVTKDTTLATTTGGEEIKPEIAGEVANIEAVENAQVMPGTKLMDIVDYSDLQLKVQVDENDLPAVSIGKAATVTIHALNKDLSSQITDISKEGEYLNGITNFTATLSLPAESDLRVGMSAEAKILNQSVANAVILPMSAIQFDEYDNPYVMLKDGNRAPKRVAATIGINDGVHAEIKKGVTANDIVLVPPAAKCSGIAPGLQAQNGTDAPSQGVGGAKGNE